MTVLFTLFTWVMEVFEGSQTGSESQLKKKEKTILVNSTLNRGIIYNSYVMNSVSN